MKKTDRKPLSMFSQETLDSLEMAEILGGDDNKDCRNNNCSNEKIKRYYTNLRLNHSKQKVK